MFRSWTYSIFIIRIFDSAGCSFVFVVADSFDKKICFSGFIQLGSKENLVIKKSAGVIVLDGLWFEEIFFVSLTPTRVSNLQDPDLPVSLACGVIEAFDEFSYIVLTSPLILLLIPIVKDIIEQTLFFDHTNIFILT